MLARPPNFVVTLNAKVLLGALLDRMASIPIETPPPERHASVGHVASDVVRPLEAHEHLLIAAALPLTLADALRRLPHLVRRLRRTEAIEGRTQRERFRRKPFVPWDDAILSC